MDEYGSSRDRKAKQHPHVGMLILSQVRFLRESLAEVFTRDGPGCVLGLCADLSEAIAMCRALHPDIILVDAAFPDGVSLIGCIHEVSPATRVVVFAVAETEESVISWAEAGISGYVPSTAALSDLSATLTLIIDGVQTCEGRVAAGLLRRLAQTGPSTTNNAPRPTLTAREQQIVAMISAGLSNKDIARQLKIGLSTTKSHVHNLLGKLNIQRRGQAVTWIRQHQPAERTGLGSALASLQQNIDGGA
jgi:DNA-binding NarL/FixJ family response regulator